jgi:hypothetical protein
MPAIVGNVRSRVLSLVLSLSGDPGLAEVADELWRRPRLLSSTLQSPIQRSHRLRLGVWRRQFVDDIYRPQGELTNLHKQLLAPFRRKRSLSTACCRGHVRR